MNIIDLFFRWRSNKVAEVRIPRGATCVYLETAEDSNMFRYMGAVDKFTDLPRYIRKQHQQGLRVFCPRVYMGTLAGGQALENSIN